MPIAVGTKAPDFSLKSKNAAGVSDVKLSANFGKKNTVILFFPLAFTSVCTTEMCDITAGLSAAIANKEVTYDLARLMEPRVEPVSCSGFAEAVVRHFGG